MQSSTIKSYDVYVEVEPGNIKYVTAVEKAVDSDTKTKFTKLAATYGAVAEHARSNQLIPSSIATSAYQLVNASSVANNVAGFYNNNQSFRTKTANYIAAAVALAGKLIDINLTVTVYFTDGSKAVYKLEGVDGGGALALKVISATDIDNNTIPFTKQGYESGSFDFTKGGQRSIDEFVGAANRSGVPITTVGGGGGGGGGGTYTMTCNGDGSQCTVTFSPY